MEASHEKLNIISLEPPEGALCMTSVTAAGRCLSLGLLQNRRGDDYVTRYGTLSFDAKCDFFCIYHDSFKTPSCACARRRFPACERHVSRVLTNTRVFFSARASYKRRRLVEFTPGHAPSVQLVATLLMTSLPRASIGPETSHTGPIAWRWSDVSRDRVPFTLNGAGRGGEMIEAKWRRDAERWLAEKAARVNVCCWEKSEPLQPGVAPRGRRRRRHSSLGVA